MRIRYVCFLLLLLNSLTAGEPAKKRWEAMEYGPTLSGSFVVQKDNYALRGVIVRLDKETQTHLLFDTETMRVTAAWTGGFIDWKGVVFNGEHHAQPGPKGKLLFTNKQGPGWADPAGSFTDPRKPVKVFYPLKPADEKETTEGQTMPAAWMKYKGLYMHGEKVVFSYRIGECDVLESPSLLDTGPPRTVVVRDFDVGPSNAPLTLSISDSAGTAYTVDGKPVRSTAFTFSENNLNLLAKVISDPAGAELVMSASRLIMEIPPRKTAMRIRLMMLTADPAHPMAFNLMLPNTISELRDLIKGGPPRWTETVQTSGTLGDDAAAYTLDTLTLPDTNPWNAWMRLGGFDFFPDGKSAAVSTWSGDVWIVTGIDKELKNLTWKRFATGLHQPLGLKIVDGKIYTTCRDQITRLHDLNNDGEADFYENFNSDCHLTRQFHEFSLDLQTDKQGNFYYAKGTTPGRGGPKFDLWSIHSGGFFKVSKDGTKFEVVARGLRAPNGIGIGPNGEMTSGDNEGSWVPSCPINWITPGSNVGIPDGVPGAAPIEVAGKVVETRVPPICWLPKPVDNSGGGQAWVTSDAWGPFKGQMLHLSYGTCSIFNVMYQKVEGANYVQGGVARFPLKFASGGMRPRFSPADGQLYVCGLKGWQTVAARDGIFQRMRYTGKPANMPLQMRISKSGIELKFTDALDVEQAKDVANYAMNRCNLKWAKEYGSAEYSLIDPAKKVRDAMVIKSVKLSDDAKTVTFEVEDMRPASCVALKMKIKGADGGAISQDVNFTVHAQE